MTLKDDERNILIEHYQAKNQETVEQVKLLLANNQNSLAMNRVYYAIYYMLSALALKEHFSTSKHLQLIGWFNKTFVKGGAVDSRYSKLIQKAYEDRVESDYDVRSSFTKETVEQAFAEMQEVIAAIEQLLEAGEIKQNGQDQNP